MRHKLRSSKMKGRIFVFLIITVLSHWNSFYVTCIYQSLPIILATLSIYSFGGLPILYRNKWNVNSEENVRKYVLFYLRTNYNFSLRNLLSSRSANEVADLFRDRVFASFFAIISVLLVVQEWHSLVLGFFPTDIIYNVIESCFKQLFCLRY